MLTVDGKNLFRSVFFRSVAGGGDGDGGGGGGGGT